MRFSEIMRFSSGYVNEEQIEEAEEVLQDYGRRGIWISGPESDARKDLEKVAISVLYRNGVNPVVTVDCSKGNSFIEALIDAFDSYLHLFDMEYEGVKGKDCFDNFRELLASFDERWKGRPRLIFKIKNFSCNLKILDELQDFLKKICEKEKRICIAILSDKPFEFIIKDSMNFTYLKEYFKESIMAPKSGRYIVPKGDEKKALCNMLSKNDFAEERLMNIYRENRYEYGNLFKGPKEFADYYPFTPGQIDTLISMVELLRLKMSPEERVNFSVCDVMQSAIEDLVFDNELDVENGYICTMARFYYVFLPYIDRDVAEVIELEEVEYSGIMDYMSVQVLKIIAMIRCCGYPVDRKLLKSLCLYGYRIVD